MRKLGQHFLKDTSVLRRIARALALSPGETVIEVGAGHGELTAELLRTPRTEVVAIEKDPRLAEVLRERFGTRTNFHLVPGDVRRVLPDVAARLGAREYKLAGNIPYYLTGLLFRMVGDLPAPPARAVLMVQREVAERVAAAAPRMNRLAASVQFWSRVRIVASVSRRAFNPPPAVDSAVLLLDATPGREPDETLRSRYYALVRALFAQPRKTVWNNLVPWRRRNEEETKKALHALGIALHDRPQQLSIETLLRLARSLPSRA